MDRRRLGYAVLGLLALVVVALAASTLATPVEEPGGETGVGEVEDDPSSDLDILAPRFDFVVYFLFGAVVLLAVAATYGLLRRPIESLKGMAQVAVAGVVAVAWIALILFLMEDAGEPPDAPPVNGTGNDSSGGNGTGTGGGDAVGAGPEDAVERLAESPELVLVAGLGLLTLGVIAAALVTSRSGEVDESFRAGSADRDTLSAIARVAGEAADRMEGSAAVENEVYRAWKRMTDLLDVEDPDVRTPGEFREAAVAAGMAPGDVDELTDLFEAVRYGDRPVTDDRERRAIDALRRIEETYGEGSDRTSEGEGGR